MHMLKILHFLGRIPKPILYACSTCIAWLLRYVFRYRRSTIIKNLQLAFPEISSNERIKIMHDFYTHLSDVIVEFLILAHMTHNDLAQHVTVIGKEHLETQVKTQQSFLIVGAHQANWEWMVAAISQSCPCPMDALYRPLHNKIMDDFFKQTRSRFCSTMLPADNAPKAILKLRKTLRAFGMIADQSPRRREDKYWVNFMGTPTAVFPGLDRIASITSYPVFFVATEKIGRGRYQCTITPLASPPYMQGVTIAERYMHAIEQQIRRQPALWMWSHHRWHYQPEDCPEYSKTLNDSE